MINNAIGVPNAKIEAMCLRWAKLGVRSLGTTCYLWRALSGSAKKRCSRLAAAHGQTRIVAFLFLSVGRDLHNISSVLRLAALRGHAEIVEWLLIHKRIKLDGSAMVNEALRFARDTGHAHVAAKLLGDDGVQRAQT